MQKQNFIYNLLVSPRFRFWRHISLIAGIFVIGLNNTLIIYDFKTVFDVGFFISTIFITISYLAAIYFNLYYLIQKLLLNKKYIGFVIGFICTIIFLEFLLYIIEYLMYVFAYIPISELSVFQSYNSLIFEVTFNIFLLSICIMGVGAIVLLKQWIKEDRSIAQLKNEFIQSEVEQLKERISPQTLFKILNNAAEKAKDNTVEASAILVKLSQVLRYQLYDCSRDKVLLKSEIVFIQNYLTLLQMNNKEIEYDLESVIDTNFTFVPPLLFTSVLQLIIDKSLNKLNLNIVLKQHNDQVYFSCEDYDNINNISDTNLVKIKDRLNILYSNEYSLILQAYKITMKIPV